MPSQHCRNYDGPINVTGCVERPAVEPKGLVDQKNQEPNQGENSAVTPKSVAVGRVGATYSAITSERT